MIKFDKNEFLEPQIYSTLDEYETRCNVTKEIIKEIDELQKEIEEYKNPIKYFKYANKNVTEENKQLKMINKEYERLNKVNNRGFKITNVKEYDIKENWNKLKEYLHNVDVVVDYSENYDGHFINYDELIDKMKELEQGSDSNV